jgi:hypothetical protein
MPTHYPSSPSVSASPTSPVTQHFTYKLLDYKSCNLRLKFKDTLVSLCITCGFERFMFFCFHFSHFLFKLFVFLSLYLLEWPFTLDHAVDTHSQSIVHKVVDQVFSDHLHVVESVIKNRLSDVLDYSCLEASIVPKILALGLMCILFR